MSAANPSSRSHDRSAPAREALLNGPALLIMSAVILVALWVLFPRQPAFRDPQNLRASDALSIAYLRVLVRSDPDNVPLRLSFVQLLTEAGSHPEAVEALAPLLAQPEPRYAFEIALAKIRLQLQQLFRAPESDQAQTLRASIRNGFDAVLLLALTVNEQTALLAEARKFGEPAVLAALFENLLTRRDLVGVGRGQILRDAAAFHLAANQPAQAAARWREAFDLLIVPAERREVALSAMQAWLAAGRAAEALKTARHVVGPNEDAPALLQLAADIAQQNGEDQQAIVWLYRLRDQQPEDVALSERLLALELALGNLPAALELAESLNALPAPTPERQLLLARAFDWNGDGARALPHWFALAMASPDPENEARAFALSDALQVDANVVALVEAAAQRRPLQAAEANAYVRSGLRAVEPAQLTATLQRYLSQQPTDRASWIALAHVRQAAGEVAAALQAWQRVEQLAPLKASERLAIAENYWRSGQPEPALNSLLPLSSSPPAGQEVRYWQLLAELGWALERPNVARPAYQQLLARYEPDNKLAIDRLLQLAQQSGDVAVIERQALYGWSRLRAREYFVVLLDVAHRSQDFKRIDQLLAEAQQQENRFRKEPLYWQFRAERAMARGDSKAARQALEQLASLRANDPEVIEALLWLLLAEQPAPVAQINLLVERHANLAEADPLFAEVMAAAEQVLGRPAEAARWYGLSLPARARDLPWLLTVADNLEWLGCTVTANQFRVRVLQQLQVQAVPLPPVTHPNRLADHFYGRQYFSTALDSRLADQDALQELIEQWQLQQGLDNARYFALRWQQKRLQLSDWEDVADEWQEQNRVAIAALLAPLQAELALAPEGPLSDAVLPLSLNDVAARSRRSGANRAAAASPDPARELAVCRQQLAQFSALALPLWQPPVSETGSDNRSSTMVKP
ncbi:MAG TPA: tetratricopeptide repeat protein [Permianibacter sp.]|nr:tetratricopeptide repeat protein [Permianibacter sp.]